MNSLPPPVPAPSSPLALQRRSSWKKKLLVTSCVLLGIGGLTAGSAAWWYQYNLNTSSFNPVHLTEAEQQMVQSKLAYLENEAPPSDPSKTLVLNEREINGFLEQQGLGETIKVKIHQGGISAHVLTPVDPEVPLLGGQTVRIKVAFNTKLDENHRLSLSLADISVGGISLPNAWLGNVKGLNLLDDQSSEEGFFKSFAAGIKDFQLRSGEMRLVLND